MSISDKTMLLKKVELEPMSAEEVLVNVYKSMKEKGYDPVAQIASYLVSGEPTYITSYNDARNNIRRKERDELIEELIKEYVKAKNL